MLFYYGNKSVKYIHDCNSRYTKNDHFWHTVNLLKEKTPLGFLEHMSIEPCSIRKCNKKIKMLCPFLGIYFFVEPSCEILSTLTAYIQEMWLNDLVKLCQVIASHIDNTQINFERIVPITYGDTDQWISKNFGTNWTRRQLWHLIQQKVETPQ